MSYNQGGYSQQGQQGYGQYNPYGQSGNPYGGQQGGNPYAQQEQAYGHTGNYSERPDLHQQPSSHYDEESAHGGSYEMSNMNGRDPNRILNEVRNLDAAVDESERDMQRLQQIQKTYLQDPNTSRDNPVRQQVDAIGDDIMTKFRGMVQRIKTIKQDPEAQNPRNRAQVGKIERRVKAAMNQMQQVEREYRQASKEIMERNYRIVRPDASEAEVQEAVEQGGNQVFSDSLINSNRRGQAQSVARTVKDRHEAIQKVEQEMAQLAQLFNDLEALVVQQEPAVTQIEEKGMEASGHVAQANTELDGAVKKARSARKKKWMCLGIAVLIIIIIAVVVAVAVTVTKKS